MDGFNREEQAGDGIAHPLLVSELSEIIESLLDTPRLQEVWVRGEITNYTHHARGHRYFSLSEKGKGHTAAVIKCVIWRSDAERLTFDPAEGMEVIVLGTVRLYAPHGVYQLQVRQVHRAGTGEKFLLLERWKKELGEQGFFAAERKRPLPSFPKTVGVVTSETGAVIHDIRTVIERRYPVEIIISPTAVQGETAHLEIADAIRRLAGKVDVIIVARGGGSFEDLFPFNNPDVVKAIAGSPVPVVSAVGHEVDVTLADLASDIRAPTPSAAAELVVPDRKVLALSLDELRLQLRSVLLLRITRAQEEINDIRDRLRPKRFGRRIDERKQDLAEFADRLLRAESNRIERDRLLLAEMRTALSARSQVSVLARGYCIAEKEGLIVKSVNDLVPGDHLCLRLSDGKSKVVVERVDHDGNI